MALRNQLETAFKAIDTEKTGLISKVQLEKLLNKLNPDLTDSDLEILFSKLDTSGGNVKFLDFIDLFCPKPAQPQTQMARELSKPMSEADTSAVKKVFESFDKDKSGYIDLKELAAMCTELGKKISDDQAAAAMQQLDKNGDGRVTFDEFALWWTCTPGLGGYNHVVLGFLKGKLALKSKMNKTFNRVVRKKLDNTDEFSLKANVDIMPDKAGTKVQSSVCVNLNKKKDTDEGPPCVQIKLAMKDADSAAAANANISKFMGTEAVSETPMPSLVRVIQEGPNLVITINLPEEMFEDEAAQAIAFLQDAAKQVELKVGLGATFEEVLASPNLPLCQILKGGVFGADLLVGLTSLVGCSREEIPEQAIAALKCLGGVMLDTKLQYNHPNLLTVVEKFKSISERATTLGKLMSKGISYARTFMYEQLQGGPFEDGKWSEDAPLDALGFAMQIMKDFAKGCIGVDTVSILRLPGSTVEIVAKFDKFNPFPMVDYFCGHFPGPPPGYIKKKDEDDSIKKPLSADEQAKLKATFDKYDKDKSGKIDLRELKGMLTELGAKVEDDEVEEGMSELDTNSDGTCSFDEFKDWWSSKSSCGGYSSYALKFMKGQMKVSSMLSRVKSGVSSASGYLGKTENQDETYVKFQQEITPGMVECQAKMSVQVDLKKSDTKPSGSMYSPSVSFQFQAKSDADAKVVAQQFTDLISSEAIQPMYEMMSVPLPKATTDGTTVSLMLSAPSEMVEPFYSDSESAEFLQVSSVFANAIMGSGASTYLASDFNDLLADPDSGVYSQFGGAKVEGILVCSAEGKALILDAIKGRAPFTGLEFEQNVAFPIEIVKLFQSLDLTYLLGYHKDNLEKAVKHVEDMARLTAPSASREMLASMAPPFDMLPPEMVAEAKKTSKALEVICDKLDSVKAVVVDGIYLPGKDACTVSLTASFTNWKMFDYIKYMTEPVRQKIDAA
jgi:Ca2+-binding EF-hand superfamily protein